MKVTDLFFILIYGIILKNQSDSQTGLLGFEGKEEPSRLEGVERLNWRETPGAVVLYPQRNVGSTREKWREAAGS